MESAGSPLMINPSGDHVAFGRTIWKEGRGLAAALPNLRVPEET